MFETNEANLNTDMYIMLWNIRQRNIDENWICTMKIFVNVDT